MERGVCAVEADGACAIGMLFQCDVWQMAQRQRLDVFAVGATGDQNAFCCERVVRSCAAACIGHKSTCHDVQADQYKRDAQQLE